MIVRGLITGTMTGSREIRFNYIVKDSILY